MKILSIDTSCDETAAAVTEGTKVLTNIIWSQASLHAKFGGVMPSLAQRQHEEHIGFVVKKALGIRVLALDIDAIAVTVGPGLSIALGVGINKAKELAKKYNKPLISVNHVEAHLLSSFANNEYLVSSIKYPVLGLVISGGNTQLILVKKIGEYEILAETQDDALGEALDKSARMLGLGYPGGAILEKMAKLGDPKKYSLPVPLVGDKIKNRFSYSGLKTSMSRKIEEVRVKNGQLSKQDIYDLAASFQHVAFKHVEQVLLYQIVNCKLLVPRGTKINNLLVGGGVSANTELRKRIRKVCKQFNIQVSVPYSKKLLGDNAAMIGVCAFLRNDGKSLEKFKNFDSLDREPRLKI